MISPAKNETLIAIIGTAVLTVGFYFGVFRSNNLIAHQMTRDIAESQAKIDSLPLLLAERVQLKSRLDRENRGAAELDELVPSQSHVSEVLHKVARLAQYAGLTITRLEPLPSVEFCSYTAHPFHLACQGTFADVARFLNGLESQARLVTFGGVDLVPGGGSQGNDTPSSEIHASVHFNVYSRQSKTTKVAENTASRGSSLSDN